MDEQELAAAKAETAAWVLQNFTYPVIRISLLSLAVGVLLGLVAGFDAGLIVGRLTAGLDAPAAAKGGAE